MHRTAACGTASRIICATGCEDNQPAAGHNESRGLECNLKWGKLLGVKLLKSQPDGLCDGSASPKYRPLLLVY
jgi:hypothetical protein